MERRNFIKRTSAIAVGGIIPAKTILANEYSLPSEKEATSADREYWVSVLSKIATPVLGNLSKGTLRKNMPVEYSPIWDGRNKAVAYMEAFGRLIAGMAPWLALPDDATAEGKQRKQFRDQAFQCFSNSVDPANPDYMLWKEGPQSLVDAAYIAQTFLRAPDALWKPLDNQTKQRYINEFKGLRRVKTPYNNWLLFAAMVETFLLSIDEAYDPFRIDLALRKMNEWYVGDGWHSDGPHFAFDYYNGYVIHSMLVDVLYVLVQKGKAPKEEYELALKRMRRYSEFLERLISPEGTYPAFGRSVTYRTGAFQPLAQLALMDKLPDGVTAPQVRCALTAVKKRMFDQPGVFTKDNWLQLGFAGHQSSLADYYSNTGSMYITSLSFLPLGLPSSHLFWTGPFTDWTSRKAWSGQPFKKDYAVEY
jgi:hypothetical protein